jgi:hypothetical protein
MENEKTSERHKEIERLATALWIKFYSNEYGMTKDLFTLAIQDERIVAQQTASLQSELSALQERNKQLEEVVRYCQSKAYTIVNTQNAINHKYVRSDAIKMKDALDKALSKESNKE